MKWLWSFVLKIVYYFNEKMFNNIDVGFLLDSYSSGFILLYKKIVNTVIIHFSPP
jgi:hypothetical protein